MQNISSFHVLGAIETYELLEKIPTGIEKIDNNTMIELLELLCYYNNEEETDLEAHQLLAGMFPEEKEKTWMADGLAQRLYSEVIDSPRFENDIKDRARLAILCGKAKCRGSDKNNKNTDNVSQILEECKVSFLSNHCSLLTSQYNIYGFNNLPSAIDYISLSSYRPLIRI